MFNYSDDYFDGEVNGNMVAGIFGAFLFSFIGVALWFVIYQLGYVAGITGMIMYGATIKGYELFGKRVNLFASIACIIISILMIFFAEISCLAFEVYKVYKNDYFININIFDAFRAVPELLTYPDVLKGVMIDLLLGCFLTCFVIFKQFFGKREKDDPIENFVDVEENDSPEIHVNVDGNKNRIEDSTDAKKRGHLGRYLSFFWVVFSLGAFFTNWIPFLYFGFRYKKPKFLLWSLFYFAPLVILFYINNDSSDIFTVLYGLIFIASFIMGIVHTIKVCVSNLTNCNDIKE